MGEYFTGNGRLDAKRVVRRLEIKGWVGIPPSMPKESFGDVSNLF